MALTKHVLHAFLKAKGSFVSGTRIAEELGISRVSVHHHLDFLRGEGFSFKAVRNKGYQLTGEPDSLNGHLLDALLLANPCPFYNSHLLENELDSTNSLAEAALSAGRTCPFFILADSQNAGRGRRGREWHSPGGKNIYLSVALRPSLPPTRIQAITLWLGLRLCQFLRNEFALPVQIKWPNDLMLHDRKLAGMLTEARVDSESTRDLVFGLGLNVNLRKHAFPEPLRQTATSLAEGLNHPLNLTRLAHKVLVCLAESIQDFLDGAHEEELTRLWPEYDHLRGRRISSDLASGTVLGISTGGSLRVQRNDGSIALLHSGEVSLRA